MWYKTLWATRLHAWNLLDAPAIKAANTVSKYDMQVMLTNVAMHLHQLRNPSRCCIMHRPYFIFTLGTWAAPLANRPPCEINFLDPGMNVRVAGSPESRKPMTTTVSPLSRNVELRDSLDRAANQTKGAIRFLWTSIPRCAPMNIEYRKHRLTPWAYLCPHKRLAHSESPPPRRALRSRFFFSKMVSIDTKAVATEAVKGTCYFESRRRFEGGSGGT